MRVQVRSQHSGSDDIRLYLDPSLSVATPRISVRIRFRRCMYQPTHFSHSADVPRVRYIFACPARALHGCPEYTKEPYKHVLRGCRCQLDGSSPKVCRTPDRGIKTNQHRISPDPEYCGEGALSAFRWPSRRNRFVDSITTLQSKLTLR
jgi:hypothetical protein